MLPILWVFERSHQQRNLVLRLQYAQSPRGLRTYFIVEIFLHGAGKRFSCRSVDLDFGTNDRSVGRYEDASDSVKDSPDGAGILDGNVEPEQRVDGLQANVLIEIATQRVRQNRNAFTIANAAERGND